jgi:peptidoglycan/LPS O-acetylase OafA/YrhL
MMPGKIASSPTRSFPEFQSGHYFTALDGLRAASILLVILHHVPHLTYAPLLNFQDNGRYGVSFFFAISGFLICTLLLRERRKTGGVALGKFYGRRALRLLPLYYLALALEGLLVFGLHQYTPENQALFRAKLPAYLFYYSNWLATSTQGPFLCSWSLAVEEQFYLVFGLMLVLLPRRFLLGTLAAGLLAKFAVYQILGNVDVRSAGLRVIFSYQEAIIWGVLLAFALDQRKIYQVFEKLFRSLWVIGMLLAAVAWWLVTHRMRSQSTWDAEILYLVMTLIVAGMVIRRRTPILGASLPAFIGKTSYGIYLLHMFVIDAVKRLPGGSAPVPCLLLTTALVLPLAALVYHYFELPIIHFYKARLSPGVTAPAAVPRELPSALGSAQPAGK